jgi:hypothetical protein
VTRRAVFEPLLPHASAKRASAFCEHMLGPGTCAHGSGGQCCLRLLPGKTRDGASGRGAYGGEVLPKPTHRASQQPGRECTGGWPHLTLITISSRTGHAAVSIGAHGNSSSDEMASTGSITLGADSLRSAGSRSRTSPAGTGHSPAVREKVGRPESMKQAKPERARHNVGKGCPAQAQSRRADLRPVSREGDLRRDYRHKRVGLRLVIPTTLECYFETQ